jgi:hypothetical protein
MANEGRRRPYRMTSRGRSSLAGRLRGLNDAVQTGLRRIEAAS